MKRIVTTAVVMTILTMFSAFIARAEEKVVDKSLPYWNTALSFEERARGLVGRMTNEEKAAMLSETQDAVPRLGIEEYHFGNEALHGVVRPGPFTVFPMAAGLAATWDTALIHEMATAISDEARGKNNKFNGKIDDLYSGLLAFWSPTINMARDPRWGRTPETYGEDPFLSGSIAVAFIKGLQGDDPRYIKTVSTCKHFAANNEEHNRLECNAKISERALREYYFPAFRMCVEDGNVQSIMGAYNAINGVPCNADKWLLTDVLRGDWGFDGYVVTDCAAPTTMVTAHKYAKSFTESAAFAISAGVDLECGGDKVLKRNALTALAKGMITQEQLDTAVYRVLLARFRLGMFDPRDMVPFWKISPDSVGSAEHVELARQVARKSMVLLKNNPVGASGAPLLPLDVSKLKSIAVVGPNAAICRFGDYSGSPANPPVTPLDGIKNAVGPDVKVRYVEWLPSPDDAQYALLTGDSVAQADGAAGFKAEYFAGAIAGQPATVRTDARIFIDTANQPPDPAIPHGAFSVRWSGAITPKTTGEYSFGVTVEGGAKFHIDGKLLIEAIGKKKERLKSGQPLKLEKLIQKKADRLETMLFMQAGKTYSIVLEYTIGEGTAYARLDWIKPSPDRVAARESEMKIIRDSDAVIAFLGIGLDQEREGIDRVDLELPYDQREYIRQALAANPKTIPVLISGSPMSINQLKADAPAILQAWYPGEQGGNAIADVLFGRHNPAGRLPFTFYKTVTELPPFDDYEVSKGRTYMYMENEPLFAFGHGLSYTAFDYSKLRIDNPAPHSADTVTVSVDVRNTGARDGEEVVQIYVRDPEPKTIQPRIRLLGFRRAAVPKGETVTVTIPLRIKDFALWDDKAHAFSVDPGAFVVMAGASSADIRLEEMIEVVK